MVVLQLLDEDGHGDRDDALATGKPQQHGGEHQRHGWRWSVHGGDHVVFRFLHRAGFAPGLATPRNENDDLALLGGLLFPHGGHLVASRFLHRAGFAPGLATPRNGYDDLALVGGLLYRHGGDPDGRLVGIRFLYGGDLAPGLAPPRNEHALVGGFRLFLRGGDADGDLVGICLLHGAGLATPRNERNVLALVGEFRLFLRGGDADGDLVGIRLLHGADLAPGLATPRNEYDLTLVGGVLFLHGADGMPPRTQELVRAVLLHHQHRLHGVEGLFQVLLFLNIGDGGDGDDRESRDDARAAPLGLWGGDDASDADVMCAAHRILRLRGGAADDDHVPPLRHSWVHVIGVPMVQTVPGTCALVAATVCIEAQHRRMFEHKHGAGTFACRAAAPRKLRRACYRDKVWNPSTRKHERTWDPVTGAWSMGRVLTMMKRLGGARTTNAKTPAPFFLPLKDWERYSYEDGDLTAETAARLLYKGGPCIGTLFATPEFFNTFVIPGSDRPPAVYRGCSREERKVLRRRGQGGTMHAVVCFAYGRTNRGRLYIEVLDSQRALGPISWVDFDEFDVFYVLRVEALSSVHLLDFNRFPPLVYPVSEYR